MRSLDIRPEPLPRVRPDRRHIRGAPPKTLPGLALRLDRRHIRPPVHRARPDNRRPDLRNSRRVPEDTHRVPEDTHRAPEDLRDTRRLQRPEALPDTRRAPEDLRDSHLRRAPEGLRGIPLRLPEELRGSRHPRPVPVGFRDSRRLRGPRARLGIRLRRLVPVDCLDTHHLRGPRAHPGIRRSPGAARPDNLQVQADTRLLPAQVGNPRRPARGLHRRRARSRQGYRKRDHRSTQDNHRRLDSRDIRRHLGDTLRHPPALRRARAEGSLPRTVPPARTGLHREGGVPQVEEGRQRSAHGREASSVAAQQAGVPHQRRRTSFGQRLRRHPRVGPSARTVRDALHDPPEARPGLAPAPRSEETIRWSTLGLGKTASLAGSGLRRVVPTLVDR